jgi:hypothetical protein
MVHINTKYVDNTTAALEDPLGLAVVGIFYTLSGNQESFLPMTVSAPFEKSIFCTFVLFMYVCTSKLFLGN